MIDGALLNPIHSGIYIVVSHSDLAPTSSLVVTGTIITSAIVFVIVVAVIVVIGIFMLAVVVLVVCSLILKAPGTAR